MSISVSSGQAKPEFSVRIVVCDHYSTKPTLGIDVIYSDFRGSDIKQVPVLRIFGSTPDGHKACLHVHGVFPYFYIPCPTPNPEPQFLYQIAASLDKALNIALKQATSANQHVYKISLVKGLPFYGFHDKDHLYLKVFLYSPNLIKQAVELCSNGAILGQTFQPHESHLNFTLQFFIDFNLFGMSNIDLEMVKFRKSGLSQNSNEPVMNEEFSLKPESTCFYEADCVASHIINRQRIGKGDGIENPGLEEVWHQEMERRKQLNISMASKSLSQGRIDAEQTESHYKYEQMMLVKLSNLIDKPVDTDFDVNVKKEEPIHYPAESLEGTQLFNAVDVSMHLPDSLMKSNESVRRSLDATLTSLDETLVGDADDTIVDENVALNCSLSLHYSQVHLDNEDLELVDMLQDMDAKPIEQDSIMGTPAEIDKDGEHSEDDLDYSQAFDNDTILLNSQSKDDSDESSPGWNDSFWDGVNIPQLDGTHDDERIKKVRKRKMRPFKLALSRPKNKKEIKLELESESALQLQNSDTELDEINASRETIDSISDLHLKRSVKKEIPSKVDNSFDTGIENEQSQSSNESIADLVNKYSVKQENAVAEMYDLDKQYEPVAGPSRINEVTENVTKQENDKLETSDIINASLDSYESTPEYNKGIVSFYNTSKIFDLSLDDNDVNPIDNSLQDLNDVDVSMLEEKLCDINVKIEQDNRVNSNFQHCDKVEDLDIPLKTRDMRIPTKLEDMDIPVKIGDMDIPVKVEDMDIPVKIEDTDTPPKTENLENEKIDDVKASPHSNNTSNNKSTIKLTPKIRPPTKSYITSTLDKYNIPKHKNPEPYFSDHKVVGEKVEIGQLLLKLQSKSFKDQKPFEKVLNTTSIEEWRQLLFLQNNEMSEETIKPENLKALLAGNRQFILQPIKRPPLKSEVVRWSDNNTSSNNSAENKVFNETEISKNMDDLDNSQALGLNEDEINSSLSLEAKDKDKSNLDTTLQVTMQPDGSFLCFGNNNESQKEATSFESATVEVDFLTLMLVELHTSVRGDLHPDPTIDPIQAIFVKITNDCPPNHSLPKSLTEIIVVDDMTPPKWLDRSVFNTKVSYVNSESEIIDKVIELVKLHDPDIMCGYEIEMNSWGYLLERAQVLGFEIVKEVSRITEKHRQKKWRSEDNDFEGRIIGRIMFNVWRLFRYELALSSYSFENCMFEVLKERVPKYAYTQLSEWWNDESRILRWIPVEYYLTKLSGTVRMLEKLDIINRTSELARLFGLQWWEVLSRGSQFRVESLMLRAARPLNLVALSPTVRQRAAMKAPECLPLIFEPESRFYSDPVIVLDFQSLYPSMMIAYNYCFSTCIGRVQNITGESAYEFGAWRLRIPKTKLETLIKNGHINWSPVGVGFVKPSVRRGVLPALLRRILAARQAVKKGMKLQTDEGVKKAMHSRQLGLKLIANVTYGYTAANFSGRMPCVEVGDSVVAKGRETLERAIKLVRNSQWNAKVVYGDTDSMFVVVPGGTRTEAFEIGQRIADAVTADNPSPVALKLEKVYQPCILQTKKRYVGYMYESADQEKPVYEAKGIETVRRDGCPAGVKLLQRSLCELFEHGDMSRVKRIVKATLSKLVDGTMPPQDLFFTREYHGAGGYRPGAAAPPNEIAKRISSRDRRAVPRPGMRVFWQVCAGPPGAPLVKLARTPEEIAGGDGMSPHVGYYACRVLLPPLHRCLSLLGANVFHWWNEVNQYREITEKQTRGGIARYMWRRRCALCGTLCATDGTRGGTGIGTGGALCTTCARDKGGQSATAAFMARFGQAENAVTSCDMICNACCGHPQYQSCVNTECPVLWRRLGARHRLNDVRGLLNSLPEQSNTRMVNF